MPSKNSQVGGHAMCKIIEPHFSASCKWCDKKCDTPCFKQKKMWMRLHVKVCEGKKCVCGENKDVRRSEIFGVNSVRCALCDIGSEYFLFFG